MPILRGSATYSRFRVEPTGSGKPNWKKTITTALRGRRFEPLDRKGQEDRAAGWVELEDHDAIEFSTGMVFQGEYALFAWRVDEFRIPASTVKTELEKWKRAFEKENARPPGRREKNDAKLEIRHTLRQRAPIVTRTFDVSWHLADAKLQLWSAAAKIVDEVGDAISQGCSVRLLPLVPALVASDLGLPEKELVPTPALALVEGRTEVDRG